jgi:eukaryotic-like serine/threonine-protein kinase
MSNALRIRANPLVKPAPERADDEVSATAEVPAEASLDATLKIANPGTVVLGSNFPADGLRHLGSYDLLEELGSGGMGIVYAVRDRLSGLLFALKILRPTLVMEADAKLRFQREARAMAAIEHQRIVPVVRIGEDKGIPYIVMPLLVGKTLEDRLNGPDTLNIDGVFRIGMEIAEGLEIAHRHGLIHRDVKPANVWLEAPNESVCLLDFGLARETSKQTLLTDHGTVMGTPAYMSPEQARGEHLDPRSDLFSLGCILYQMTTGIRPFDGPVPINILGQLETYHPPRVTARNPAIPTLLSNLIMELLAKNPKDRPASARDVMDRLRRIPILERSRSAMRIVEYSPADTMDEPPVEELGGRLSLGWKFWLLLFLASIAFLCFFAAH